MSLEHVRYASKHMTRQPCFKVTVKANEAEVTATQNLV
jgi:hypothetical protein